MLTESVEKEMIMQERKRKREEKEEEENRKRQRHEMIKVKEGVIISETLRQKRVKMKVIKRRRRISYQARN